MTRLVYNPRPYQDLMVEHVLARPRAALWAGMGLGKTVATLSALSVLDTIEPVFPALILAPLRVARDVWPDEIAKWGHLSHLACVPITGTETERQAAVRYDSPLYSMNYENLEWLHKFWGDRWPYRTVVADEATRLKSYRGAYRTHPRTGKVYLQGGGGIRARALAKATHTKVRRFIELTGTPAPNGLQDLWAQIWFLDAGERLGRTFEGFKSRWFRPKYDGYGIEIKEGADKEIHERVKDLCLTIDAKDGFDLKEPIVNTIYVNLPPAARKVYREMEKNMFAQLGEHTVEAFNAAARTQKCLQLANGAVYIDPEADTDSHPKAKRWKQVHDVKLQALESVISEANGAPVIVAYEFRSDLARIQHAFPRAVNLSTREGLAAFKTGGVAVGLGYPQSIGHGIDGLQQVCNHICFFGHNWNLETFDQIRARIGPVRQLQAGFERPVFETHIVARDTVDELVMERRDSKREVQDLLLAAMKRRKR